MMLFIMVVGCPRVFRSVAWTCAGCGTVNKLAGNDNNITTIFTSSNVMNHVPDDSCYNCNGVSRLDMEALCGLGIMDEKSDSDNVNNDSIAFVASSRENYGTLLS